VTGPDERPPVSAVVPTRDRPELLRKTIAAIVEQRYAGAIEVVVVYDQSEPDASLASAEPDRSVRVITNQRTPGLAGGRNTGILAATYDLVAFCDDDDVWLPGKLEAQVEALAADPSLELVTTGTIVDYRGRLTPRVLDSDRITFDRLVRSRTPEAVASSFLIRRAALLDGLGLVDEELPGSFGEDYDLLLRAARRHPVGNVSRPLVRYLRNEQSFFTVRWQTIIDALDHLVAKHPELRAHRAGLARIEGQQAFALAALGQRREARATARRVLTRSRREPRAYLALLASTPLVRADQVLRLLQRFGRGI
jgi:glycosyltransferase involved in cell wall biosynthesis